MERYNDSSTALFAALQRFTQLHSLELRGNETVAAHALAAALNTLPALISLELDLPGRGTSHRLTVALGQLRSTQLDHLSVNRRQLNHLVIVQKEAVMPRLRSLTITAAAYLWRERRSTAVVDRRWVELVPSLQHLAVSCTGVVLELHATRLPALSSLTLCFGKNGADLRHINTPTLCLRNSGEPYPCWHNTRAMRDLLQRCPRM